MMKKKDKIYSDTYIISLFVFVLVSMLVFGANDIARHTRGMQVDIVPNWFCALYLLGIIMFSSIWNK